MDQSSKFDLALFNRYDKAGARYISYPTALELHDGFYDEHYRQKIAKSNSVGGALFVYFHILFVIPFVFITYVTKLSLKPQACRTLFGQFI